MNGALLDEERVADRARDLAATGHNAFRLVYVSLEAVHKPGFAWLDVEFHNAQSLAALPPREAFVVTGGVRIRAGALPGQVQVTEVHPDPGGRPFALRLKVAPVGDYSSYVLSTSFAGIAAPGDALPRAMDPLLNRLPFKFRPGCFNLACAPRFDAAPPRGPIPSIDYLARDYDSFRHLLMAAMAQRVPGWKPTSEADLDQVLIDLIAAQGDELADHHDRVIGERSIVSARKRVSLARHARLVDYHLHQGNQASTWVAAQSLGARVDLPVLSDDASGMQDEWAVWSGRDWRDADAVVFALPRVPGARWRRRVFAALNTLQLYTWGDSVTALAEGATSADLHIAGSTSEADAIALEDLFNGVSGDQATAPAEFDVDTRVEHLLIEEARNPATGTPNGRSLARRQLLRLVPLDGDVPRAQRLEDPVTGDWFVRVHWLAADALTQNYCFVCDCAGVLVRDLTLLHANLLQVTHGRPHETVFQPPSTALGADDDNRLRRLSHAHTTTRLRQKGPDRTADATVCVLPEAAGVLAYRATPPDGIVPPCSTVQLMVDGFASPWEERIDLVLSEDDDEHFIVETHENQVSQLRFGNGVNGRALPQGATARARFRSGQGVAGNVGADVLTSTSTPTLLTRVWNPFDVTDGRAPESTADLVRRAPEAYRRRQLRAVTLADYAARAAEVDGVAQARAAYRWSGSWRVVRVAIDPVGGGELSADLRARVAARLDALRLIGDDVELRAASYVPLDIRIVVCAHAAYWIEDLRTELEMAFSDVDLPPGSPWPRGLFHPDLWSFGQPLYASQLIGRALSVTGVERVVKLGMRRFNPGSGGGIMVVEVDPSDLPEATAQRLDFGEFEVLVVANDPDHLERGRIVFEIEGGRR